MLTIVQKKVMAYLSKDRFMFPRPEHVRTCEKLCDLGLLDRQHAVFKIEITYGKKLTTMKPAFRIKNRKTGS